jgi:hypothetical protein
MSAISFGDNPELCIVDTESVKAAKRIGVRSQQTVRNIPKPYERPGTWPRNVSIGGLPSAQGFAGSGRTVHPSSFRAQSHLGASLNLPALLSIRDDLIWRQSFGPTIIGEIRKRLMLRR